MPADNNRDSVTSSISCRLHNFTKPGAPWIVTRSSSDFYKNQEFSIILKCTVPSLMLFYNLTQSRVVSKAKIGDLLGHYRRDPNLQNSFRLTIHYHAIYYWNVSLGLRMCSVSRTYIEIDMMHLVLSHCPWFNAIMFLSVGSSFVSIIGLWMLDPKSPYHLPEQTQSF